MNNLDDSLELEDALELKVRPREAETVSLQIPKDTLASLKKVAEQRDMSLDALLKLYIGKYLRQDLSQLHQQQQCD